MLLDIPAVADTDGTVTNVTWNSTGEYSYLGQVRIPGSFVSDTFGDGNDVAQTIANFGGAVLGNQSAGNFLLLASVTGQTASATETYIDATSGAIFSPTGLPVLPPNVFVYIDPIYDALPFILKQSTQDYTFEANPGTIKLMRNPRQGSVIKFLTCVLPTFTIPQWAKSWSLKNVSGALMYFRRYGPNVEANVIDTPAATFGEDYIVGQELADDQVVGFSNGEFTPGSSYIICAAAAAANGAIVEFYP